VPRDFKAVKASCARELVEFLLWFALDSCL
jgi:hypothetical protein